MFGLFVSIGVTEVVGGWMSYRARFALSFHCATRLGFLGEEFPRGELSHEKEGVSLFWGQGATCGFSRMFGSFSHT